MKVCILSMQHVQNFGSLLQSYSLKKCLQKLGCEVFFIDIKRMEEDDLLLNINRKLYINEIEGKNSSFSKLKKIDKYTINRFKIKYKSNCQLEIMNNFRNNILGAAESSNDNHYDMCVIGSDEVFNCMAETPWGFTSQLFGNVEQADKVITYAASCGFTTYTDLPPTVSEKITETFKNVSAISVRDKNTKEFVEQLSSKQVFQHLDPVLVGDFDNEIEQAKEPSDLPGNFCIVYSYYNRIHKKEEIDRIKSFCKKNKLEIVTVGAPQMWVKNHLVLTPFELLKVFKKASFVITDTFHGTIFSVRYSNKFAVLLRDSNKNKLFDLVCRLGIKEHLINNITELRKAFETEKNSIKIEQILKRERQNTENYLRNNIGCEKFYE